MAAISDFSAGTRYALRGLSLLTHPGIRLYAILPILINTLIFGAAIWFGAEVFAAMLEGLLPAWLDWLRWLLWPLFAVMLLVAVFFGFTMLVNLIAAPLNGLLASHVETLLTGSTPDSGRSLMGEVTAALASALRMLAYVVPRALALLLVMVIPGMNLLAPMLWFLFGAWLLALGYVDAPSGNSGQDFRSLRARFGRHRACVMGFGVAMGLLTLIPVLNFVAIPAGVAGATLLWVERLRAIPPTPPPSTGEVLGGDGSSA